MAPLPRRRERGRPDLLGLRIAPPGALKSRSENTFVFPVAEMKDAQTSACCRHARTGESRWTVGGLGRIAIDNPGRHNAVSLAMWQAIPGAVDELERNGDVRAIVLTGSDEAPSPLARHHRVLDRPCGRGLLRQLRSGQRRRLRCAAQGREADHRGHPPLLHGGGVGLAVACDVRIAADDAAFGIPAAPPVAYPPEAVADIVARSDRPGPRTCSSRPSVSTRRRRSGSASSTRSSGTTNWRRPPSPTSPGDHPRSLTQQAVKAAINAATARSGPDG